MEQTNTWSVFGRKNRTDGIMLQTTEIWNILLSLKTLAKQWQKKMTIFLLNNRIFTPQIVRYKTTKHSFYKDLPGGCNISWTHSVVSFSFRSSSVPTHLTEVPLETCVKLKVYDTVFWRRHFLDASLSDDWFRVNAGSSKIGLKDVTRHSCISELVVELSPKVAVQLKLWFELL